MQELTNLLDWKRALREARRQRRISQTELARRSGLSLSAVKAYESGSRHPSQEALSCVIEALGLTHEEANPIRAGAGYAIDWNAILNQRYLSEPEKLGEQVQQYPWPVFVTNQRIDLICANRAFEKVWDVDLSSEFLEPGGRNLFSGATIPRFVRQMENWHELVALMIGLMKGDPRLEQNLESPAPWLQDTIRRFLEGDPAYVTRVLDLWEKTPPIPHKIRHRYDVRWRYRGERPMRFVGVLTVADIWNELSWNEWLPADGQTW
ncbi:MAG: helix-turn-helix domain-containing protein [Chloroflexi bacterium]|nr:helix-turn-helix domain-containing protein [Chloroflexota bacterium]